MENQSKLWLASLAASVSCVLMTPVDTVKTRLILQVIDLLAGVKNEMAYNFTTLFMFAALSLTSQHRFQTSSQDSAGKGIAYAGILDCFQQV